MDLLIRGAFVVTMNPKNDILDRADVAIKHDRISYVGPPRTWPGGSFEKVIPAEELILIPGLINAHYHSTQNLIRGMFYRFPLEIWRQYFRGGSCERMPGRPFISLPCLCDTTSTRR